MTKDLTSGSPLKVILMFTFPLVLGNLFQQFYALADTIIVGRFCGVSALASVGATAPVNYLILGFVIGVCNGFAIPIAQLFGARDYKDLCRHVANAAWLCIAASVVLTIATVALTRPMMQLMQTPDDIIDGAVIYIGWIFAGIPFIFLYNMVAAIMRAFGRQQNAALLPDSDQCAEHRTGLAVRHSVQVRRVRRGAGDRHFPGHFRRAELYLPLPQV